MSLTSIQLFVAISAPFTAYGEQLYLHLKILVTIQSASIGSFLTTKSNLLSYLVDFLAPNIKDTDSPTMNVSPFYRSWCFSMNANGLNNYS